ncbi:carboxypeptidase regulatory-like domain-containing protein [Cellulomonas sp. URHE0023]|uniref:carboxypeptidase regulatory-like domain-containing protein n=1 Tax=Cellulomonas sp. URHE0023 TaxID=1380354 RepID=UPI00047F04DC|nr:carboxypeptidase regulatory-like domain-containing protein [Cellulomonas sp. URHE0023]
MKPSSSHPAARRLAGLLAALALMLGLGALVPVSAVADVGMGAFAISGTVTDDTGAPVADVSVQVSPGGQVTTDAAGHYTASGLMPGSYTVTFVPPPASGLLGEAYDNVAFWNPTQVAVSDADVTGIDAVLDHAGTISGKVLDTDGGPIAGVAVQLQSVAFVYASTTTGADGTYTAGGLRPGDWRVSFTAPNGSAWVSELYDDAHTPETQTVVPLAPGASVTLHDAVLARGGTISGRILAPDGTPRAGIEVYASTDSGNGGGATTGADGAYTITGLADGDYLVNAQSDWGANLVGVVYPGTTHWADAEHVHVSGAAPVLLGDMTLVAGASITGTVFGPDGAPLAGATVYALSQDGQDGSSTGSDGTFTIKLLPPGTYQVMARNWFDAPVKIVRTYYAATPGETRASQSTPVPLAAGGAAEGIDIHAAAQGSAQATVVATVAHAPVLGEPFTIDVTVTGAQGVPTGSVWVGSTGATEIVNPYADADLDASGHATLSFDAVDQGTYPVVDVYYVGDATYALAAAQVDYVPGAEPPAITSLAPASGTVLGGEHVAITGTGFGPDSTVTFGGVPATVAVESPTSLVATAPAHAAGPVDVVVTTQGQPSSPATYTYQKVASSLTLTGPTGSTTAGSNATFTATVGSAGGVPAGSVAFAVDGGSAVSVPLVGGTAAFSTSALAAGAHTVVATFAGDATYAGSTAQVNHTVTRPATGTLPVVDRATPSIGLTAGGTLTVLTGKNFVKGKTAASFGGATATKVTVLSSTRALVVVPKHAAGTVKVTVTTPAGTSATSARFTYVACRGRH